MNDRMNMMDRTSSISVVVLNYNGKDLLEECLTSLRRQTFRDFEVIIVDNASEDGSAEIAREQFPEYRLILNSINEGTSGYNAGIEASLSRYVLLLNNDTALDSNCLEEIIKTGRRYPEVGMFALNILIYDKPGTRDSAGIAIYRDGTSKQNCGLTLDDPHQLEPTPVLLPSGAAGVYKKEVLEIIGLFDPIFFAYCEDTDLGLRARLAGCECLFIPTARVYHKVSSSWGALFTKKAMLVERNRFWLTVRTFPLRYLLSTPFYTLYRYFVQIKAVIKRVGQTSRLVNNIGIAGLCVFYLKILIISLKGLPEAWHKRRRIMASRGISSKEFGKLLRDFGISAEDIFLNPNESSFSRK
ncbi:MAG: glycosyltransferase family 2 protein [FCB group bacterium]|nr:glycosyltransferase family 2 protein [FCB group bacterium]